MSESQISTLTPPCSLLSEYSIPFDLIQSQRKKTPLAAANELAHRSVISVGAAKIGGEQFTMIAGPCAVEGPQQIDRIAQAVRESGASILRGGVYKPRTSTYSFQGKGEDGLQWLVEAGDRQKLAVVTEVMAEDQVEHVAKQSQMLQIGARNMQNFALLRAVGRSGRPVLLKRGIAATIDEFLHAAEYIMQAGNSQVVLCERGIRTFESSTRYTLDLSAVPVLLERSHLPVIVDPSHAAGARRFVPALARAAKAIGAHGVIVEIHSCPDQALSDGPQALTLEMWNRLAKQLQGPVISAYV